MAGVESALSSLAPHIRSILASIASLSFGSGRPIHKDKGSTVAEPLPRS